MRTFLLLPVLLAVAAIAWLIRSGGGEGSLADPPTVPVRARQVEVPGPPLLREVAQSSMDGGIGLYRPGSPETRGPALHTPDVLIRLPSDRRASGFTGRQVLGAVSRVVPVRGRTEDDLRALEALDMEAGWGEGPDPVPLDEILTIWAVRGVDVHPTGGALVVEERRHGDPEVEPARASEAR